MPADLKRIPDKNPIKVTPDFDRPNREHIDILHRGVKVWNQWRKENPTIIPHLAYIRFRRVDFSGYNFNNTLLPFAILSRCKFQRTTFRGADMRGASLRRADLTNADLNGAILRHVSLAECIVQSADFSNSHIYGISAWNLIGEPKDQSNMIINAEIEEAGITIDDIEVAQFIFLLLNNPKIRNAITTIASKTVLILGRFSSKRKAILESIREKCRKLNLLPVLFDFNPSPKRDLTETIQILASLSKFVIADITDAKSIPQELSHIIPNFPSVPVQPIILASQKKYAMYPHWEKFNSVLPVFSYKNRAHLLDNFKSSILEPVENWNEEQDENLRLRQEIKKLKRKLARKK